MARMIPSFVDDRTPPGETDVFNLISTGPDDWVVMHSLDLAPWNRQLRTEIDFLVIIPNRGIVCIEVKSQEYIGFDGQRWSPASITRSPFKQAIDGSSSFHRRIAEFAPHYKFIPIVAICIFPRSIFTIGKNLAVSQTELIDAYTFKSFKTGNDFCRDLDSRIIAMIRANPALTELTSTLTKGDIEFLISCCVPVQKRQPSQREQIERQEVEAENILRRQQKLVLNLVRENDRVIIEGAAGTGKTLIAIEAARTQALKGKRVGLLCFNQLIGDWIKERAPISNYPLPNLIAGRAIQVLIEMTNLRIPNTIAPNYWDEDLPQLIEERLTDPSFTGEVMFDYLVIDEAQDILARPRLWECLSHTIVGGIENGSFSLFGDFESQAITNPKQMRITLDQLRAKGKPAKWRLTENCRNYRIVGKTAVTLAGLPEDTYSEYLRSGGGHSNYDINFYETPEEQLYKLKSLITHFKKMGYRPAEITILSLVTDRNSAAASMIACGAHLRSARQPGDQISYSTIHAFKGMENKIIILTDLLLEDDQYHRSLLYTGLTRSTDSVRLLCDHQSQATLLSWLEEKHK